MTTGIVVVLIGLSAAFFKFLYQSGPRERTLLAVLEREAEIVSKLPSGVAHGRILRAIEKHSEDYEDLVRRDSIDDVEFLLSGAIVASIGLALLFGSYWANADESGASPAKALFLGGLLFTALGMLMIIRDEISRVVRGLMRLFLKPLRKRREKKADRLSGPQGTDAPTPSDPEGPPTPATSPPAATTESRPHA